MYVFNVKQQKISSETEMRSFSIPSI